jgi:GntR family transcriptional repressor for pyruvate dehydrogenase complex
MVPTLEIEPPDHSTLIQEVTERLLSLMVSGKLQPGDRLPSQSELSAQLRVGRSTVREALRTLNTMGLVELRQGQGTFVKELNARSLTHPEVLARFVSREMTEQLFEARQIIEPEIVAFAAQRATPEDLAVMEAALRAYAAAFAAGQPLFRLSANFHRTIASAAHSQVLSMFMDSLLTPLAERGLLLEDQVSYLEWEQASHWNLYHAIASHDIDRAREAMIQHLCEAREMIWDLLP